MSKKSSYIYIMTNELYCQFGQDRKFDLYKVGKANDIEKRRKGLSNPSGMAAELKIVYKVMCDSEKDASAIEKQFHERAKSLGIQYRENREFVKCLTIIPMQLLIRQIAREMRIPIVEWFGGSTVEALELFKNAPCLPHEIFEKVGKIEKKCTIKVVLMF